MLKLLRSLYVVETVYFLLVMLLIDFLQLVDLVCSSILKQIVKVQWSELKFVLNYFAYMQKKLEKSISTSYE